MKEVKTRLLLPKGEWLQSIIKALAVAGLEISPTSPRSLEYTFVTSALPIVFSAVRSWDVWPSIDSPASSARGGFTGTDIAREQLAGAKWMFPLRGLTRDAPRPYLFIGATPNLETYGRNPRVSDVVDSVVYTSYPNTTALFLGKRNVRAQIQDKKGAIEGFWRIDPKNKAIVDITDTGKTMRENGIEFMENITPEIQVAYVESDMPERDQLRVADLREVLFLATARRRDI